jgi:hypothetical protein
VLKSKFTPSQLIILDGKIAERAIEIAKYCKEVTKEENPQLPDVTTPGALPLEQRLAEFLNGPSQVLLLQAPKQAGKSLVCPYLAIKAWKENSWAPVYIDLTLINTPTERCVEKSLNTQGLDDPTIAQLKEGHTCLLLIEGFDKCQIQTNLYARNQLQLWRGKAVFTCRSSYLAHAVRAAYYFMPGDFQERPNPQGLAVICFSSVHSVEETEESLVPRMQFLVRKVHFLSFFNSFKTAVAVPEKSSFGTAPVQTCTNKLAQTHGSSEDQAPPLSCPCSKISPSQT